MLDSDLADLYGVQTKALLQAVRRNPERFPSDFAFPLRPEELPNLRSQFVTSSWGGRRHATVVFTEQGVAMLSSVLHSHRAVRINVAIMRAFVRLRGILAKHRELARRLEEMEKRYDDPVQGRVRRDPGADEIARRAAPGEGRLPQLTARAFRRDRLHAPVNPASLAPFQP